MTCKSYKLTNLQNFENDRWPKKFASIVYKYLQTYKYTPPYKLANVCKFCKFCKFFGPYRTTLSFTMFCIVLFTLYDDLHSTRACSEISKLICNPGTSVYLKSLEKFQRISGSIYIHSKKCDYYYYYIILFLFYLFCYYYYYYYLFFMPTYTVLVFSY